MVKLSLILCQWFLFVQFLYESFWWPTAMLVNSYFTCVCAFGLFCFKEINKIIKKEETSLPNCTKTITLTMCLRRLYISSMFIKTLHKHVKIFKIHPFKNERLCWYTTRITFSCSQWRFRPGLILPFIFSRKLVTSKVKLWTP